MTSENDPEIESVETFVIELESILKEAHRNDIAIEGGWLIETSAEDVPNWDLEIWPAKDSTITE